MRWPPPSCIRDPTDLAPLPEEEPLIARSVAKRRNEFVTVRYCARQALVDLGLQPVPILKGDKGEPCWPDGVVGSLTHCEGSAAPWSAGAPRFGRSASTPNPMTCCPTVCSTRSACRSSGTSWQALPAGVALGPDPVLRQGGDVQGVVPADASLAGLRGRPHHLRPSTASGTPERFTVGDPDRPGRRVRDRR